MNHASVQTGISAGVCLLIAGVCAFYLTRLPMRDLPQAAASADVLSILFGDTKKVISHALLEKADSYFHGGIDMGGEHHCELHDSHDDRHHDAHDADEVGHEAPKVAVSPAAFFDPWAWINTRIRAPQVEKHLEGKKAVELIPLLWASVRADPHNSESWTAAWYIAARTMRDPALGLQIILAAERENPADLEIALTLGRAYYQKGKDHFPEAETAFGQARRKALLKCHGHLSDLSEDDSRTFSMILDYLAFFAAERKDRVALTSLLADARSLKGSYPASRTIAERLSVLK